MKVLTMVVFVLLGIEDLRIKKIPFWPTALLVLCAIVYGIFENGIIQSMLGMIPGMLLLAISIMQPQSLGKGDGLIAIAYGNVFGWRDTCIWLFYSFFLVSIIGVLCGLLIRKKKMAFPLVPFMGIVHMGMCL